MKDIPRYEISKKAEAMYRKNARRDREITYDILSRKISALIYASMDRYYYSDEDAVVAFGSCLISFSQSTVTSILWCNESHKSHSLSEIEKKRLQQANEFYGLNRSGNDLLEPKETSDYQIKLIPDQQHKDLPIIRKSRINGRVRSVHQDIDGNEFVWFADDYYYLRYDDSVSRKKVDQTMYDS